MASAPVSALTDSSSTHGMAPPPSPALPPAPPPTPTQPTTSTSTLFVPGQAIVPNLLSTMTYEEGSNIAALSSAQAATSAKGRRIMIKHPLSAVSVAAKK